jgi:hypothetical protein
MATIVFSDGRTKIVSYDQAAKMYQVLQGNKEPENEAQSTYLMAVKNIIFDKTIPR